MKARFLSLAALLTLGTVVVFGANKTEKIDVKGNCGMCEKRIEKAALNVTGVSAADWNQETNKLEVTFDDSKTNADKIEMAVAKVGHDTPHHKAADDVYNKLPGCCKYDRGSAKNEGATQHQH